MTSAIRCAAKGCGVLPVVERAMDRALRDWTSRQVNFLGLDTSTRVLGWCVLRANVGGDPGSGRSSAPQVRLVRGDACVLPEPRTSADKNELFHSRCRAIRAELALVKEEEDPLEPGQGKEGENKENTPSWVVCVEEKLLRSVFGKGIVGLASFVEMHAATRVLAHDVFGVIPITVNPSTSRKGLGLNLRSGGEDEDEDGTTTPKKPRTSSRARTKDAVVDFVARLEPVVFQVTGQKSDEDRADAYIVALHAVRASLLEYVVRDAEVAAHFSQCHHAAKAQMSEKEFQEKFRDRATKWVDDLFLARGRFPNVLAGGDGLQNMLSELVSRPPPRTGSGSSSRGQSSRPQETVIE